MTEFAAATETCAHTYFERPSPLVRGEKVPGASEASRRADEGSLRRHEASNVRESGCVASGTGLEAAALADRISALH